MDTYEIYIVDEGQKAPVDNAGKVGKYKYLVHLDENDNQD